MVGAEGRVGVVSDTAVFKAKQACFDGSRPLSTFGFAVKGVSPNANKACW